MLAIVLMQCEPGTVGGFARGKSAGDFHDWKNAGKSVTGLPNWQTIQLEEQGILLKSRIFNESWYLHRGRSLCKVSK